MVRTQSCHCQNPGFNPWWGNQDPTCFGQKISASLRGRGALEYLERGRLGRTKYISSPSNSAVRGLSVQSLSRVRLFATPRTAAHQASLSIANSQKSVAFSVALSWSFNLAGMEVFAPWKLANTLHQGCLQPLSSPSTWLIVPETDSASLAPSEGG